MIIITYRDWQFEVDKDLTESTYRSVTMGSAEECGCNNCRNYAACLDKVFPEEVLELFDNVGIDYRREAEVITWQRLANGLHHIDGWFHFKGRMLRGKSYIVPLLNGGDTFDYTEINDDFSIGFAECGDLAHFEDRNGLIQLGFTTYMPWVIHKSFQTRPEDKFMISL